MECVICGNRETVFVSNFKPFLDIDWQFPIYDCNQCECRFAVRDSKINYHEVLYEKYPRYEYLFQMADVLKNFLDKGQMRFAEFYLKQWPSFKSAIEFVEKNDPFKSKKVLEIGSSTGFLVAYLRAKGHKVWGVDISETATAESQKRFGNFYSTHTPKEKFDLVYSCGSIGSVDFPLSFLQSIFENMSENAIFHCNSPNKNALQKGTTWLSTPPPDMITIFSPKTFAFVATSLNANLNYREEENTILATITYPINFSAQSTADKLTRFKYKYPLLSILINKVKSSIRRFINWFNPKKGLAQYGLMVYLQKVSNATCK
jgi:SAM-dependent methyltransferase